MLRRRTLAVDYCLNRAAQAEYLAALADDVVAEKRYRIATGWHRLRQQHEFIEQLERTLSQEKAG